MLGARQTFCECSSVAVGIFRTHGGLGFGSYSGSITCCIEFSPENNVLILAYVAHSFPSSH